MPSISNQPIKVKRGILWKDKPYSKSYAWVFLIRLARHQEIPWHVKGRKFTLQPGRFYCRKSDLADRWGWRRLKVQRFFKALESEGKITQELFDGIGTLVEIIDPKNAMEAALYKKNDTEFSSRKKKK